MHSFIRRTNWFLLEVLLLFASVSTAIGLGCFPGKFHLNNTLLIKQVGISVLCYLVSFWFVSAFYISSNRPQVSLSHDLKALIKGSVISVIILSCFFLLFESWRQYLLWVPATGVITMAILMGVRILEWLLIGRKQQFLALFIGLDAHWLTILDEFRKNLPHSWTLRIAFMHDPENNSCPGSVKALSEEEIRDFINFCRVDNYIPILIIDGQLEDNTEIGDFIRQCFSLGLPLISINRFYETVLEKVALFRVAGKWVTQSEFVPPPRWRLLTKRLADLILAIILFFPSLTVFVVFAVAIKMESKGPIFFIQERVGRRGKVFRMVKLRTMKTHEDDSAQWPHVADDYITSVGKILRKTGIDELPQLLNIILGDMSFVGPRPARPIVSRRHAEEIPFFALCYSLPPGITGWAQIHQGRDTGIESVYEKIRYNIYYVKNFSILFDLRVVLRTIKMLLEIDKPKRFGERPQDDGSTED